MKNFRKMETLWKDFRDDIKGDFSMMVALVMLLVILCVGVAIDVARAYNLKSEAQNKLDAAVLAAAIAAQDPRNSVSDIEDAGKAQYELLFNGVTGVSNVSGVNIEFDSSSREATGTSTLGHQNAFMGVFGFDAMEVNVTSVAMGGVAANPIDVGLMLDVSGSMSGSKIAALKSAVVGFLDVTVGATTDSTTRVAFAPFSTSVNAGAYGYSLTGIRTPDNCVAAHMGGLNGSDNRPLRRIVSLDGSYTVTNDENDGVYREGYFNGYTPAVAGMEQIDVSTLCPDAEIFPLSNDYNALKTKVMGYDAGGLTAGHLGIAYSWYLISENWRSFWPTASQPGTNASHDKYAILMSDGQFNTYYDLRDGLPEAQGEELCDNMKADGVIIYSVSFDTSGSSEDLLRACASETSMFFDTDTAGELIAAFDVIARTISTGTIRLTQ